ncbi:hypothetical protein [Pedococcus sp. P5_B7]
MTSTGSDFPEPSDCPEPDRAGAIGRWPFGLEAEEVERPHVVVTLDTRTGGATFSGPYRTAIGALCAADVEYQVDRDQGGRGERTFHVATLHTPVGCDDADLPCDEGDRPFDEADTGVAGARPDARPLAQVLSVLATVAERTIRRRPRLTVGTVAVTAAAAASGVSDGWPRRGRAARYRHLLGREAR